MRTKLLFCPNCNCIEQRHCDSNIGIPMRDTFVCKTCNEVYANWNGEMVTLKAGDPHKHKEIA